LALFADDVPFKEVSLYYDDDKRSMKVVLLISTYRQGYHDQGAESSSSRSTGSVNNPHGDLIPIYIDKACISCCNKSVPTCSIQSSLLFAYVITRIC